MKGYFKADVDLIGRLIKKDSLRYTSNNVAILFSVFSIPGKNASEQLIRVVIKGKQAELIEKESLNQFYLVGGMLSNEKQAFDDDLPSISVVAASIVPTPEVEIGLISCRVVGRLTADPKLITKTNDYFHSPGFR